MDEKNLDQYGLDPMTLGIRESTKSEPSKGSGGSILGEAGKGLARGTVGLAKIPFQVGATVGRALGAEDYSRSAMEVAKSMDLGQDYEPEVSTFKEAITSPSKFLKYGASFVGSGLPGLAALAASSAAGPAGPMILGGAMQTADIAERQTEKTGGVSDPLRALGFGAAGGALMGIPTMQLARRSPLVRKLLGEAEEVIGEKFIPAQAPEFLTKLANKNMPAAKLLARAINTGITGTEIGGVMTGMEALSRAGTPGEDIFDPEALATAGAHGFATGSLLGLSGIIKHLDPKILRNMDGVGDGNVTPKDTTGAPKPTGGPTVTTDQPSDIVSNVGVKTSSREGEQAANLNREVQEIGIGKLNRAAVDLTQQTRTRYGGTVEDLTPLSMSELDVEKQHQNEAKKLGIIFNGMQETPWGKPIPMFTDRKTGGTFSPGEGETVEGGLNRIRSGLKDLKLSEDVPDKDGMSKVRDKAIYELRTELEEKYGMDRVTTKEELNDPIHDKINRLNGIDLSKAKESDIYDILDEGKDKQVPEQKKFTPVKSNKTITLEADLLRSAKPEPAPSEELKRLKSETEKKEQEYPDKDVRGGGKGLAVETARQVFGGDGETSIGYKAIKDVTKDMGDKSFHEMSITPLTSGREAYKNVRDLFNTMKVLSGKKIDLDKIAEDRGISVEDARKTLSSEDLHRLELQEKFAQRGISGSKVGEYRLGDSSGYYMTFGAKHSVFVVREGLGFRVRVDAEFPTRIAKARETVASKVTKALATEEGSPAIRKAMERALQRPEGTVDIVKLRPGTHTKPSDVIDGMVYGKKTILNTKPGERGALGWNGTTDGFERAFIDRVKSEPDYRKWIDSLVGKKIGFHSPDKENNLVVLKNYFSGKYDKELGLTKVEPSKLTPESQKKQVALQAGGVIPREVLRPDLRNKYRADSTAKEMIERGDRTALYFNNRIVEPGDVFTVGGVELRATRVHTAGDPDPSYISSKLGVDPNHVIKNFPDYVRKGKTIVEFERVKKEPTVAQKTTTDKKVTEQERINRIDLKANPNKIYLFGDNLKQSGFGGQAREMRGEPNAVGIPTKKSPSMDPNAFMTDSEYNSNIKAIDAAFAKIPEGKEVVIPKSGIGTGLAQLQTRAPKTWEYLQLKIGELKQLEKKPTEQKPVNKTSDTYKVKMGDTEYEYNPTKVIKESGGTKELGWFDKFGNAVPKERWPQLEAIRNKSFTPVTEKVDSPDKILYKDGKIFTDKLRIDIPSNLLDPNARIVVHDIDRPESLGRKVEKTGDPLTDLLDAHTDLAMQIANKHGLDVEAVRNKLYELPQFRELSEAMLGFNTESKFMADKGEFYQNATRGKVDKLEDVYTPEQIAKHNETLERVTESYNKKNEELFKTPVKFSLATGKNSEFSEVSKRIGELFGFDVGFYKQEGGIYERDGKDVTARNFGHYDPDSKTLSLNASSDTFGDARSLIHTTGHELTHAIMDQFPETYKEIRNYIMNRKNVRQSPFFKEFQRYIEESPLKNTYKTLAERENEFVADLVGRNFLDSKFWDHMYKTDPSTITTIGEKVRGLIGKVMDMIRGYLGHPMSGRLQFTNELYYKLFETDNFLREKLTDLSKSIREKSDLPKTELSMEGVKDISKTGFGKIIDKLNSMTTPEDTRQSVLDKAKQISIPTGQELGTNLKNNFEVFRGYTSAFIHSWLNPPVSNQYKTWFGDYMLSRTMNAMENAKFSKLLIEKIPDKIRREALVNYIQAGGDEALLAERAKASKDRFKAGYETATKLTAYEKEFANLVHEYFDEKLNAAISLGMLKGGVENYITQLYKFRPPKEAKEVLSRLNNDIDSGRLEKNPWLLKQRIYQSYFDAEAKGLTPKNKDVGYLLSTYDMAFNEAIATRTFIKTLFNRGTSSDGRPMVAFSSAGKPIDLSELDKSQSFLLSKRENQKSKNGEFYTGDYIEVNHNSLRGWREVINSPDQTPMLMERSILVHPEVYKTAFGEPDLKSLLTPSKIHESAFLRGTLKLSSELKSTLLSLSMFHQVQVGTHALFHKVKPWDLKDIDLKNNETHQLLVKSGLTVSDYNGSSLFSEGVQATGLINKIPVVGEYLQKYNQWLFTEHIPKLKMNMAEKAYEENLKRYKGKLSNEQIAELTAQQGNAAFGELNYQMLGRSKTMQDILRLGALAPDFFEARARFVTQAAAGVVGKTGQLLGKDIPGYGQEQAAALLRGALGIMGAAAVVNMVIHDGDPHLEKPGSIIWGDKEITVRSVPGDILHLWRDPTGFIYSRLNPFTTRTLMEGLTSRDRFGRKRNVTEQAEDLFYSVSPIPLQGVMSTLIGSGLPNKDKGMIEAAANSFGLATVRHRTSAEQLIAENMPRIEDPNANKEVKKLHREFVERYRQDKTIMPEVKEAIKQRLIDNKQYQTWTKEAKMPEIKYFFQHINNLQAIEKIWNSSTDEEKKILKPIYNQKKLNLRMRTPVE